MTRYLFEVELSPEEEGGYSVSVPDLDGCYSQGDTLEEALEMAADALMTYIAALLKYGDPVPEPVFGHEVIEGGKVIAISVEVDADYVIDAVSPAEAAAMLSVTRGRVSQMMRDGILDSYDIAGERVVDLKSINARLAAPRGAGRPRKNLAAV